MVPLPNGTEVTTLVARSGVAAGAVGRVVRAEGDAIDVQLVGGTVLTFARDEVAPRKLGQLRFAHRREGAWQDLRGHAILRATVGSRAWGLANETSDTDARGVFVLPFTETVGLGDPPDTLVSADGSETFWEVEKAIRQALRADPNTLEMLFVDEIEVADPMGAWLLAERDAFVSRQIYGSFGRYAMSQLGKLRQSARLAEHRQDVLVWLEEEPALTLDAIAERLGGGDQARDHVKQLYRSMYDQGLLRANDLAALAAFAREKAVDFELPRELRPKNAYNLLRLIVTALGWLSTGRPTLRVEGDWNARLRRIKSGDVALEEVLEEAERLGALLEEARVASPLPDDPDLERADRVFRRIREEAARRWAALSSPSARRE